MLRFRKLKCVPCAVEIVIHPSEGCTLAVTNAFEVVRFCACAASARSNESRESGSLRICMGSIGAQAKPLRHMDNAVN